MAFLGAVSLSLGALNIAAGLALSKNGSKGLFWASAALSIIILAFTSIVLGGGFLPIIDFIGALISLAGSASGILNGKRDETVEEKARLSKLKELKDMEMALLERMDGLQDKKAESIWN
jgi:hypothetical protein